MTDDKLFEDWWTHGGERHLPGIARLGGQEHLSAVKLLCRIAYYQGKIDESLKVEAHLEDKLRRIGP